MKHLRSYFYHCYHHHHRRRRHYHPHPHYYYFFNEITLIVPERTWCSSVGQLHVLVEFLDAFIVCFNFSLIHIRVCFVKWIIIGRFLSYLCWTIFLNFLSPFLIERQFSTSTAQRKQGRLHQEADYYDILIRADLFHKICGHRIVSPVDCIEALTDHVMIALCFRCLPSCGFHANTQRSRVLAQGPLVLSSTR